MLRHSDSCTEDESLKDHDRPLTAWGRAAAGALCANLAAEGWAEPDLILCSASLGAARRSRRCAPSTPLESARVEFLGSLYAVAAMDGVTADHLRETVRRFSAGDGAGARCVMCVGHNKGWSEATSEFAGAEVNLDVATAALLEASSGDVGTFQEAFDDDAPCAWRLAGVVAHGVAEPRDQGGRASEKEEAKEGGGEGDPGQGGEGGPETARDGTGAWGCPREERDEGRGFREGGRREVGGRRARKRLEEEARGRGSRKRLFGKPGTRVENATHTMSLSESRRKNNPTTTPSPSEAGELSRGSSYGSRVRPRHLRRGPELPAAEHPPRAVGDGGYFLDVVRDDDDGALQPESREEPGHLRARLPI